jgi:hypothetical protein
MHTETRERHGMVANLGSIMMTEAREEATLPRTSIRKDPILRNSSDSDTIVITTTRMREALEVGDSRQSVEKGLNSRDSINGDHTISTINSTGNMKKSFTDNKRISLGSSARLTRGHARLTAGLTSLPMRR